MRISRIKQKSGFTMVELMVVVAIMAILASVAVPAYVNYINRTKQGEAIGQLQAARLEMEEFFADNTRYANTIGCLPSFGNAACFNNCNSCTITSKLGQSYTFNLQNVAGNNYRINAQRKIYSYASTDVVWVSANTITPQITNEDALKFSIFKWMFQ